MRAFVDLRLRLEDAEPILRQAAELAARNGSLCDFMTRKTHDRPGYTVFETAKAEWLERFLRWKRTVEAFGVEYSPVSEQETLTVSFPYKPGIRAEQDFSKPYPSYRSGVHAEACRQAAERTVRAWKAALQVQP